MKQILILSFTFILLLSSCCEGDCNMKIAPGPGSLVTLEEQEKPFSNPAIIYGTDFGNFFKTLYEQGKFEEMLSFTSQASINKFGKEKIINFYEHDLKFGYELGKPHSQTIKSDTTILNYNANIIATKKVVRIQVLIENDSCKIVLPDNLKNFPS